MTRINVLELTTTLEVGGTERMLGYLVRGLDKTKFNVSIACLTHGGQIADELSADGYDVTALNMNCKLDFSVLLRLHRLIKEKKVGILHTYLFHANFLGRIIGKLAGVPVIISSERIMGLEGKHRMIANKLTSPLASALSCNAEAVKKFMVEEIGLPAAKITVIHNGVDTEKFGISVDKNKVREKLGIRADEITCITVARLDGQKGIEILIDAAKKNPKIKFLIAGDGPLREELENKSKSKGSENILFLGLRRDIPELLQAADIFILPSHWEGFPNVVLEAMAASLPVIATNTSGTPEAVIDGETGMLVKPGDARQLAEAVNKMSSNSELMKEMGGKGRERAVKFFSIEDMIKANEELYMRFVEDKI